MTPLRWLRPRAYSNPRRDSWRLPHRRLRRLPTRVPHRRGRSFPNASCLVLRGGPAAENAKPRTPPRRRRLHRRPGWRRWRLHRRMRPHRCRKPPSFSLWCGNGERGYHHGTGSGIAPPRRRRKGSRKRGSPWPRPQLRGRRFSRRSAAPPHGPNQPPALHRTRCSRRSWSQRRWGGGVAFRPGVSAGGAPVHRWRFRRRLPPWPRPRCPQPRRSRSRIPLALRAVLRPRKGSPNPSPAPSGPLRRRKRPSRARHSYAFLPSVEGNPVGTRQARRGRLEALSSTAHGLFVLTPRGFTASLWGGCIRKST